MFCKNCGKEIENDWKFCQHCGKDVYDEAPQEVLKTENFDELPKEYQKFNWGAFFLNWIWGIGNKTYIALISLILGLIPFIGGIICLCFNIYLGINGNKLAWKNKKWNSLEEFNRIQKIWAIVGTVLSVFIFFCLMIIGLSNTPSLNSNQVSKTIETSTKNNSDNINNSQTTTISHEQKQKRLDTINNLINEGKNGGLIIDIEKFHDDAFNIDGGYIVVEESLWNQLPHETKKELCYMAEEYSQLTGVEIVGFKGYRTGKKMMPLASTIHNFN